MEAAVPAFSKCSPAATTNGATADPSFLRSSSATWPSGAPSRKAGPEITALGGTGEIRYAGASDGRIWISSDSGRTGRVPAPARARAVAAFYVDEQESRIAMAVLAGKGARVLRTINTGVTWDDLSANLPDAAARSIAVDRSAGAAYVATDAGLFLATVDLDRSGPAANWTLISGSLPAAIATATES